MVWGPIALRLAQCCDVWTGAAVLMWGRVEKTLMCTYALCTSAIPEHYSIHDSTALHRHSPCKQKSSTGRWNKKTCKDSDMKHNGNREEHKTSPPSLSLLLLYIKIKSWVVWRSQPNCWASPQHQLFLQLTEQMLGCHWSLLLIFTQEVLSEYFRGKKKAMSSFIWGL